MANWQQVRECKQEQAERRAAEKRVTARRVFASGNQYRRALWRELHPEQARAVADRWLAQSPAFRGLTDQAATLLWIFKHKLNAESFPVVVPGERHKRRAVNLAHADVQTVGVTAEAFAGALNELVAAGFIRRLRAADGAEAFGTWGRWQTAGKHKGTNGKAKSSG